MTNQLSTEVSLRLRSFDSFQEYKLRRLGTRYETSLSRYVRESFFSLIWFTFAQIVEVEQTPGLFSVLAGLDQTL